MAARLIHRVKEATMCRTEVLRNLALAQPKQSSPSTWRGVRPTLQQYTLVTRSTTESNTRLTDDCVNSFQDQSARIPVPRLTKPRGSQTSECVGEYIVLGCVFVLFQRFSRCWSGSTSSAVDHVQNPQEHGSSARSYVQPILA